MAGRPWASGVNRSFYFALWDIWPEWWWDLTWTKRQKKDKKKDEDNNNEKVRHPRDLRPEFIIETWQLRVTLDSICVVFVTWRNINVTYIVDLTSHWTVTYHTMISIYVNKLVHYQHKAFHWSLGVGTTREATSLVTRVEQPPSHVGRKKGGEEIQTEPTILLSCWDSSRGVGGHNAYCLTSV